MSTVADNVHSPGGLVEYFDVEDSRLSPYNTEPGRDYLYGTLPLFGTKLVATAFGQGGYGTLNIAGRRLAALLDTLTIVLVFLVALLLLEELGRRRALEGAFLAAALYAFTVTAISARALLHDRYVARTLRDADVPPRPAWRRTGIEDGARTISTILFLLGASLGLTVACKVSGALIAVPVFIALVGRAILSPRWVSRRSAVVHFGATSLTVLASAYVAFRVVSPYVRQLQLARPLGERVLPRQPGARDIGRLPVASVVPMAVGAPCLEPAGERRRLAARRPTRDRGAGRSRRDARAWPGRRSHSAAASTPRSSSA